MPESIPQCRNAVKFHDHTSDMRLKGENSESWIFECDGCHLFQVISKDGVINKSKFDAAAKRRQEEIDRVRRWQARKKIFV